MTTGNKRNCSGCPYLPEVGSGRCAACFATPRRGLVHWLGKVAGFRGADEPPLACRMARFGCGVIAALVGMLFLWLALWCMFWAQDA